MGDLQVLGNDLAQTAKADLSAVKGVLTPAIAAIQAAAAGSLAASVIMPVVLAQASTVGAALINTGEKLLVDEGVTLLTWTVGEFSKTGSTPPAAVPGTLAVTK